MSNDVQIDFNSRSYLERLEIFSRGGVLTYIFEDQKAGNINLKLEPESLTDSIIFKINDKFHPFSIREIDGLVDQIITVTLVEGKVVSGIYQGHDFMKNTIHPGGLKLELIENRQQDIVKTGEIISIEPSRILYVQHIKTDIGLNIIMNNPKTYSKIEFRYELPTLKWKVLHHIEIIDAEKTDEIIEPKLTISSMSQIQNQSDLTLEPKVTLLSDRVGKPTRHPEHYRQMMSESAPMMTNSAPGDVSSEESTVIPEVLKYKLNNVILHPKDTIIIPIIDPISLPVMRTIFFELSSYRNTTGFLTYMALISPEIKLPSGSANVWVNDLNQGTTWLNEGRQKDRLTISAGPTSVVGMDPSVLTSEQRILETDVSRGVIDSIQKLHEITFSINAKIINRSIRLERVVIRLPTAGESVIRIGVKGLTQFLLPGNKGNLEYEAILQPSEERDIGVGYIIRR